MPDDTLFGVAYLGVDDFRSAANLFGVELSMGAYPTGADGDLALLRVLQAASRAIDAYCGSAFTPDDITEQHVFDVTTWQFVPNSLPVISVSSCVLRYAVGGTVNINADRLYINNQNGYIEITRNLDSSLVALEVIGVLDNPVVEITYKSLQSVPNAIKLAAGYQAGHLINSGFVDSVLPANFGKLDVGGLILNNKKGYRSTDELRSGSISADAERLLQPFQQFVAA